MISVDTKKKELVGDFKNGGRELRPKGQPEPVRVHDFAIPELGKAVPYGIYDVSANAGFVNVGISADTGEFSVASIRRWWREIGAPRYPEAKQLSINADCGGSNGARLRLWKRELQVLADELGIEITICHVPPGTSKWNKIEHRLFSFITQNWRGKPLISYLVWRGDFSRRRVRTDDRIQRRGSHGFAIPHEHRYITTLRETLAAPDPAIWAEAI